MNNFYYRNAIALIGKIDSAGYAAGQVADPEDVDYASNTVVSNALVIPNVIASSGMAITAAEYNERSAGEIKEKVDGGVDSVGDVSLQLGRHLSALAALSSNVLTVNADAGGTIVHGGLDVGAIDLNNVFLGLLHQRSAYENGVYLKGRWTMKLYGLGTLRIGDYGTNQNTGDNPIAQDSTFKPSKTAQALWGETWADLALGYANDETFMHHIHSQDAPLNIFSAWMDGTDTTLTPMYLPKFADAAIDGRNLFWLNGTRIAVASFSVSTGLLTLSGAGSAGDRLTGIYPTDFRAA